MNPQYPKPTKKESTFSKYSRKELEQLCQNLLDENNRLVRENLKLKVR